MAFTPATPLLPRTIIVQDTRLYQTVDSPPWTLAETGPYLTLPRLTMSNARSRSRGSQSVSILNIIPLEVAYFSPRFPVLLLQGRGLDAASGKSSAGLQTS